MVPGINAVAGYFFGCVESLKRSGWRIRKDVGRENEKQENKGEGRFKHKHLRARISHSVRTSCRTQAGLLI